MVNVQKPKKMKKVQVPVGLIKVISIAVYLGGLTVLLVYALAFILAQPIKKENEALLTLIEKQDSIINAQKEHFKECSFISNDHIKKVTNKYWIELKKPTDVK